MRSEVLTIVLVALVAVSGIVMIGSKSPTGAATIVNPYPGTPGVSGYSIGANAKFGSYYYLAFKGGFLSSPYGWQAITESSDQAIGSRIGGYGPSTCTLGKAGSGLRTREGAWLVPSANPAIYWFPKACCDCQCRFECEVAKYPEACAAGCREACYVRSGGVTTVATAQQIAGIHQSYKDAALRLCPELGPLLATPAPQPVLVPAPVTIPTTVPTPSAPIVAPTQPAPTSVIIPTTTPKAPIQPTTQPVLALPDLVLKNIIIMGNTSQYALGPTVSQFQQGVRGVQVVFANVGKSATLPNSTVIRLDITTSLGTGRLWAVPRVGLAAGAQGQITFTRDIATNLSRPGVYLITATVDAPNRIKESNETNNVMSGKFTTTALNASKSTANASRPEVSVDALRVILANNTQISLSLYNNTPYSRASYGSLFQLGVSIRNRGGVSTGTTIIGVYNITTPSGVATQSSAVIGLLTAGQALTFKTPLITGINTKPGVYFVEYTLDYTKKLGDDPRDNKQAMWLEILPESVPTAPIALPSKNSTLSNAGTAGCSDSDGGANSLVRGITLDLKPLSGRAAGGQDDCTDDYTVREYTCLSDRPYSNILKCPTGTRCLSGACTSSNSTPSFGRCTDTDYFNIGSRGTVTNNFGTQRDACISSRIVEEKLCNYNGDVTWQRVACRDGLSCVDGACV